MEAARGMPSTRPRRHGPASPAATRKAHPGVLRHDEMVISAEGKFLLSCGCRRARRSRCRASSAPQDTSAAIQEVARRVPALDADHATSRSRRWSGSSTRPQPFKGMEINVVSETLDHPRVRIQDAGQGLQRDHRHQGRRTTSSRKATSSRSCRPRCSPDQNIYDGWINDSDLIGTHFRYGKTVVADRLDGRRREGRHLPDARRRRLHRQVLHDRAGRQALPAARPAVRQPLLVPLRLVRSAPICKDKFKAKYGYELGVPVNWSAYEDIADFFTNDVKEIDGVQDLRPHGLRQEGPVAGLAVHRCLAVDGRRRRQGHPERPAGRRMGHPHGGLPPGRLLASSRGGGTNGPAAVYALPEIHRLAEEVRAARGAGHDLLRGRPGAGARAHIAQQIFWYTAFTADIDQAGPAGDERRRHAEVAHGAVAARALLEEGHEARLPGRAAPGRS